MGQLWEQSQDGVVVFPSGRRIRGRGLRHRVPAGPLPDFGLYLLGVPPPPVEWESRWLPWRDLRLPSDDLEALDAFREAWDRAATERVEVACWRGRGRTGTALACIAILEGIPPDQAVAFVRQQYRRRTVETPWQHRYITRFRAGGR